MREARCTKCGETFIPLHATDLIHGWNEEQRAECGGQGVLVGESADPPLPVDATRARLALIPLEARCSDGCPGWCISDSDEYGLHVERCDECCMYLDAEHGGKQYIYDDDVQQLPEARAELARVIAARDSVAADALTDDERALVAKVREICSRELEMPADYPFFALDAQDGESIDRLLVRLYRGERAAWEARGGNPTLEQVVLVLCHG